jgi:Ribosomal protein L10
VVDETRRIASWKIDEVNRLKEEMKESKTVGIASIHGLPAPQFQEIRKISGVNIRVSKNSLIRLALEGSDVDGLAPYLDKESAILFSDEDAFALYARLNEQRFPLPARSGQIATKDIMVEKGETSLRPGPVLTELQKAGISVRIEGGKVVIKNDKVVVRAGEVIKKEVADALTKLEIYPFEAGLNVSAICWDNLVFKRNDLAIDYNVRRNEIAFAHGAAISIALKIGFVTDETLPLLISRARKDAIQLTIASGYITEDSIEFMLRSAYTNALAMNALLSGSQTETETETKTETKTKTKT